MTWQGASSRRAPLPGDWKQRRVAVFTRDNFSCVDCGWRDPTGRTLECDHVGTPDDHRLGSLTTRCGRQAPNNCHGRKTSLAGNRSDRRPTIKRQPERHPGLLR